ncbi:hypothetical protein PspLS_01728 [Pyricularia sp. CBS 133598]|nr:hypothetical protein PspLS_01728 [Pyricularia sp. CBS 133598]
MHVTRSLLAAVALPVAWAITPEAMLSANRYSDAVPNPSGEFALFSANKYSFESGSRRSWWNILDLKTGDISVWFNGSGISEVVFAGPTPTSIIYLNGTNAEEDGGVSLYAADLHSPTNATLVASLPAPYSGLKAARTSSGDINFLLTAKAYPNGTVYNEQLAPKARSSANIYTSLYPRHWDYWLTPQKNAVFGGVLKSGNSGYSLSGNLTNYVTGICDVVCAESPYDLNGASDYELSPDGSKVAFMTKDIGLPLANTTSTQIYLVPFTGTAKDAVPINPRSSSAKYPEAQGASASPFFSPDSSKIAYVQMNGINYESDRSILYVADANGDKEKGFNITRLAGDWDRAAGSAKWSHDGETIFADAADLGRSRVFAVPLTAGDSYVPKNITDEGSVAGFYPLPDGSVLVSDSKIWSSRDIHTVSGEAKGSTKVYFQANKADSELAGLTAADVSEFYYSSNTTENKQQAWVIRPTGFDSTKKYPLAFITHGGPQGAHSNTWSTRWNFKVWADQGYVVVAPNPTASTGFGQNLTDAVSGRWGTVYWDIVHAWEYVRDNLDYVDTENGIEAGASFGGYMTNYIQGQPLGREFKALVTHDGVTSTLNQYATDELWFMNHDFNGPFNASSNEPGSPYYDWNPLRYIDNWATPHFVIHNDLDYRLPVSEGTMLFNLLQVKGVPSKFLNFPDENHWVTKPENSLVWHKEIFNFINYYSGVDKSTSPF